MTLRKTAFSSFSNQEIKSKLEIKSCYIFLYQILGAIVDGIMPFDESSQDLLRDALSILSSKVSEFSDNVKDY